MAQHFDENKRYFLFVKSVTKFLISFFTLLLSHSRVLIINTGKKNLNYKNGEYRKNNQNFI